MEIPYTVTARADTGLWNAKIGIWLFLASEVMLFGGLFSGYIFLRLGAASTPGYDWPTGLLDVPLGFINTLILIASSVTVILAWSALKLREYHKFKIWMSITLICAVAFLGIKSVEYAAKFAGYGIFLNDGTEIKGKYATEQEGFVTIVPKHPEEAVEAGFIPAPATLDVHEGSYVIPVDSVFRWSNFQPRYNTFYAIYFTLTGLHALHVIGGVVVLGYFLFFGGAMWRSDPEQLANRVEVGGLFWHFVDLVWIFLFPILYLM